MFLGCIHIFGDKFHNTKYCIIIAAQMIVLMWHYRKQGRQRLKHWLKSLLPIKIIDRTTIPELSTFTIHYCLLPLTVPTDEEGIIPSALEKAVIQHNATHTARPLTETKPYRGMIYLIPTFHNPTGKCLPSGKNYHNIHVISMPWSVCCHCCDCGKLFIKLLYYSVQVCRKI